jgi:isocitrate lyase
MTKSYNVGLVGAKQLAASMGFDFFFDWDSCRTDEGYYKIEGTIDFCVRRGRRFSPYCDLLWMETPKPDLSVAKAFSDGIHEMFPHQMLAYNLSPSFNWDAMNMNDNDIAAFVPNLAEMGFAWQFITLAGFHMNALISELFTRSYSKEGMLAYVNYIQRQEKIEGVDQLKH